MPAGFMRYLLEPGPSTWTIRTSAGREMDLPATLCARAVEIGRSQCVGILASLDKNKIQINRIGGDVPRDLLLSA